MNINVDDIFDFYELRISCHVTAVNYFASLLGYHFPEHDNDKAKEPIRTGYAYIFYKNYHKNFHLLPGHVELCGIARQTHHAHAPHHIPFYTDVSQIPDIRIYEMVSDWASANFEQKHIIKETDSIPLEQWFNENMAQLPWSQNQLDIIKKSFAIIKEKTDSKYVKTIWQPLLEKVDLEV